MLAQLRALEAEEIEERELYGYSALQMPKHTGRLRLASERLAESRLLMEKVKALILDAVMLTVVARLPDAELKTGTARYDISRWLYLLATSPLSLEPADDTGLSASYQSKTWKRSTGST